ncbi:TRAPP II complex [Penicillium macrosclerotiorum]|uniref:TRAPP II complex n=1 Tax=Penicillium macrosclerotiorum TaxID=303699 RepID=UPI002548A234|nr:TRAPP II complex [Penicillium macrosclerotiorum]KAJ5669222.1 TRAPP II complex [Penicillium macrosclerotiorum]
MFSPLAFPTGMILYDLSFSVPPTSHLELFPFEIHREPLVIIAIADGAELVTSPEMKEHHPTPEGLDELRDQLDAVKERNPRALVTQLLVFDYNGLEKLTNGPDNVLWVPRPEASKATTMKTVLCDITSVLLSELDEFAKTIQAIPSIESPKASSWGPHRNPELRPRPVDRLMNRMTLPAQFPSNSNGAATETPLSSNPSSPAPSDHETPTTFDEITRSIHLSRTNSGGRSPSISSPKEHSRDRMSVSGLSATDRTKNRIKGRSGVVIGTLFLQAGRWPDALKELVEAATNARAGSDYVWHGKALENILLCLLMLAWAGMDFHIPSVLYPVADKASKAIRDAIQAPSAAGNRLVSLQNLANLLPDLSNTILNLYTRAANITEEPLPQLVFSETVIRLSRLLVSARIRDGALDDNALKHIVMNEALVPLMQPELPRGTVVLRKSEIANFLYRALPLAPGAELPATDAVPIIVGVVSVLSALDLPRKKAFLMRELLSVMVPSLVQARKIGAAEVGIHPAAGLSSLSDTAFDVNALDVGPGNMEKSVRILLGTIGEIYGVQPSAVYEWEKRQSQTSTRGSSHECLEYDSIAGIAERSFRHVVLDRYGDMNLKIDVLKACINCCEALPDFDGVLRFTVELLQTIRGDLMLSEDYKMPPYLPQDEQVRLLNNIKRTVGAGNRLGAENMAAEYWDDFLVRDIKLLALPDPKRPVRRSKTELDAVTTSSEKSKKDPFLYNPFAKPSSKALEMLSVTDEPASFQVTLQNPYEFEIEVEHLRLESEGVSFDAVAENIILPPFVCRMSLFLAPRTRRAI